ncbi:MAG: ATP-binding protein [Oscillospiraceae bacterium]
MSKPVFWIIAGFYLVLVSVIIALTLTEVSPLMQYSMLSVWLIIGFSLLAIRLAIRKNIFSLLFVIFLFVNVQYNAALLANATQNLGILPKIIPYEYGDMLLLLTLYSAAAFPVCYYLLIKLYKRIIEAEVVATRMKWFFCLPGGFFFSMLMLREIVENSPIMTTPRGLFSILVINVCEYAAYAATLKAILAAHDIAVEHERAFAMESQLKLWQEQYGNLQREITADAQMRHDWRHHITSVLDFVKREDLQGLETYLGDYGKKYLIPEEPPICNITGLDLMFQYYKRKCAERNIRICFGTIVLKDCPISASDLTLVFGNLLENAFESCERQKFGDRFIEIKSGNVSKSMIAICVANSYDNEIQPKEGLFLSSKRDGVGLGVSTVRAITKKNGGTCEFTYKNGVFTAHVLLIS